jgi:alkylhydroperoxidase family enzyme
MPRIAYLPQHHDQPADLVRAIRARRGGALLNLDRMLLHSPALARGWNSLFGAVRGELALDPLLRELAICAVARLNGAEYEFVHHVQPYLAAGGSAEQLALLHDIAAAVENRLAFSPAERAVLALTYEMTRRVRVSEAHFAAVRALLPQRQVVELVGVIAAYNMVSRFLVALDVDIEGRIVSDAAR